MGAAASTSIPEAKISAIFIYPIKSCRGISLSHAPLTPSGTYHIYSLFFYLCFYYYLLNLIDACLIQYFYLIGLRWDRQWVVVNSKGRACTQRVEPKLALVEIELPPEAFDEHWEPTTDSFMGILYFSYAPPKNISCFLFINLF